MACAARGLVLAAAVVGLSSCVPPPPPPYEPLPPPPAYAAPVPAPLRLPELRSRLALGPSTPQPIGALGPGALRQTDGDAAADQA